MFLLFSIVLRVRNKGDDDDLSSPRNTKPCSHETFVMLTSRFNQPHCANTLELVLLAARTTTSKRTVSFVRCANISMASM